MLKLEVLTNIASETNVHTVLREFRVSGEGVGGGGEVEGRGGEGRGGEREEGRGRSGRGRGEGSGRKAVKRVNMYTCRRECERDYFG